MRTEWWALWVALVIVVIALVLVLRILRSLNDRLRSLEWQGTPEGQAMIANFNRRMDEALMYGRGLTVAEDEDEDDDDSDKVRWKG